MTNRWWLAQTRQVRASRRGAGLIEYALIIGLVAAVAASSVSLLGIRVDNMFSWGDQSIQLADASIERPARLAIEPSSNVVPRSTVYSMPISWGWALRAGASVTGDALLSTDGINWSSGRTIYFWQSVQLRTTSPNPNQTKTAVLRIDGVAGTWRVSSRELDSLPEPFSFTPLTAQQGNRVVMSEAVIPLGYDTPVPVRVTGRDTNAAFSLDDGRTWREEGTISPGQAIRLRLETGLSDGSVRSAALELGGYETVWRVGTMDQLPSFDWGPARTDQASDVWAITNVIRPTGFDGPVALGCQSNANACHFHLYKGGSVYLNRVSGVIEPGDTVRLLLRTAPESGVTRSCNCFMGHAVDEFAATTAADVDPLPFSFVDLAGIAPGTMAVSNVLVPTGYTDQAPIRISGAGAEYRIDDGEWTGQSGRIRPGSRLQLRMPAGRGANQVVDALVTIGQTGSGWSVSTAASDPYPNAFWSSGFDWRDRNSCSEIATPTIVPTGFNSPAPISFSDAAMRILINRVWIAPTNGLTLNPGDSLAIVTWPICDSAQTTHRWVEIGGVRVPFTMTVKIDDQPDRFVIRDLEGQAGGVNLVSEPVTPVGYAYPATIRVSGPGNPTVSVGGGRWITSGQINPGQSFQVRQTSGDPDGVLRIATVVVGSVTETWEVRTIDSTPDLLEFTPVKGAAPGQRVTSNPVTLTGFSVPAGFKLTGAGKPELLLGNQALVAGSSQLKPGDRVRISVDPPPPGSGTRAVTLTIGGRTATWQVSSRVVDVRPDPFVFAAGTGKAGTVVASSSVRLTGFTEPAAVTLSGDGSPAIEIAGIWYPATAPIPVTLMPFESIRVRATAGSAGTTVTVKVTIGGETALWKLKAVP